MLFVCIYLQICRDIYSEHFSKWIFKCRSHQFDPRTWECLKYLGSTGSFISQETSQWRNWVSFKVACEFWVAQTLITLLKVIELIRLVKISTDLLLYFPKDLHNTWELLDNKHNYKTWRLFAGEEPRGSCRVSPRQDMVSYFQNVPARDSTVHIRADPWPRYTMKERYTKVCERYS